MEKYLPEGGMFKFQVDDKWYDLHAAAIFNGDRDLGEREAARLEIVRIVNH